MSQPLGAGDEVAGEVRLQEVEHQGVREGLPQPGGLAGPARPEEKEALPRRLEKSTQRFHFESQKGI